MTVPKCCKGWEHTILPQVFWWARRFFPLRGLSHLLWSAHFVPLKSCLLMYLPSFPWNTMKWETDENLTFYLLERVGEIPHTHTTPNHLKPPTMKKSKLHIQSLEMPNTTSYRVAAYSTCGHLPLDWARLFISSTVFLRESWSDRDTNTGRIYLIRAEVEGKQKQGLIFIYPLFKNDPLPLYTSLQ